MQKKIHILLMGLTFILALGFSAGDAMAFANGDRVLGQWKDGLWYPARIAEVKGDQFQINFDDGDVATVSASKLKKINWAVGTRVQCNFKNAGKYYPGKITSLDGEAVHISYDDGDQEDITISRCRSR